MSNISDKTMYISENAVLDNDKLFPDVLYLKKTNLQNRNESKFRYMYRYRYTVLCYT